jgi:hypothetical protein
MDTLKNDVALLVHTCDRYEFLYKGFYFFFSKFWDFRINCNCYFATEEKNTSFPHFKNIKSGKGAWADRLSFLLKEKITEKYILYFQEDMWLNKKVNAAFFNQLFELLKEKKWKQIKLHSSEIYKTTATEDFIEGFNIAKVINSESDFLMSHQVTLWDKAFLLQQLHKREHPWRNERKGTKRLRKLNPDIFQIDYFAENGNREINENNNPNLRSEYHTLSVNAVVNNNINLYINDLMNAGLENIQYAQSLELHHINKITHDGKGKPRKVDIFKRIKNWVKGV